MKHRELSSIAVLAPILASTAFVLELTSTPLLLPLLRKSYELDIQSLGLIPNVYSIAVGIAVLCAGYIGGVRHPRHLFTFGLVSFLAGGLIILFSSTYETLLVGRMIQGFGGGFFSPLVPLLLTQAMPHQPGRILVLWGSISGFIAAAIPVLGGTVVETLEWKPVYGLSVLIALMALATHLLNKVGVTNEEKKTELNIAGLFHDARLWCVYGYIFLTYGCVTLYLIWLPLAVEAATLNIQFTGATLSAMWLSFSAFGLVLQRYVDGSNLGAISVTATLLIAFGFAILLFPASKTVLLVSAIVMGAGFALCNAPSTLLVLRYCGKGSASLAMSFDITIARFGGVCAVILLSPKSQTVVSMSVCMLCVVSVLLISLGNRTRPMAHG